MIIGSHSNEVRPKAREKIAEHQAVKLGYNTASE
jgi:hypothetical protein